MKPIRFREANTIFAKDQPEYQPLHAWTDGKRETVSCWRLSFRERLRLLVIGKLWLRQLNYGEKLQPQLPQVEYPFNVGRADGE